MPKRIGLIRSLGAVVGAICVVALANAALVFASLQVLQSTADARLRLLAIVKSVDSMREAMLDQETGIRGYLLTGNPANLEPYHQGSAHLDAAIAQSRSLFAEDAGQTQAIIMVENAVRRWREQVAEPVIASMQTPGGHEQAAEIERSGQGKALFDQVRATLAQVEALEDQRLASHGADFDRAYRMMLASIVTGSALTLLFCAGIGIFVHKTVARPLVHLQGVMHRLAEKDLRVEVPYRDQRNEVGEIARAVEVFKSGLIAAERSSLLRVIADTVPALIGYIDRARRVRFLNRAFAQWFEIPDNDIAVLTNHPVEAVFAHGILPGYPDQFANALAGQESRADQRFTRRDGSSCDVDVLYQPHIAEDGEILGAVALITDITQRKELDRLLLRQADDLRRSNEELEQFAYVASHDLKAPLRGIDNLVSWIEDDIGDTLTGETKTNMALLHNRVRRLENLLNDLLDYSRAGRKPQAVEAIDTRALVEELAALISPPEGFAIIAAPDLPKIRSPRAPLTQVLQNLLGNAIKHHHRPSNGHVWVSARVASDRLEIVVADDGPGIPERFRQRVFGMFQTLKPRDEVEGSGMGLAIVRKLVEAHGGAIYLREREGGGLAVHFTWPLDAARIAA